VPAAISNTSPLLYLHRINSMDWLRALFDSIWVPQVDFPRPPATNLRFSRRIVRALLQAIAPNTLRSAIAPAAPMRLRACQNAQGF